MEKLLEVKDLKVSFFTDLGETQAVKDAGFAIEEGDFFGIVGESGSGKSVTTKSILRLGPSNCKIMGGEILFQGEDILKKSEAELREIRGGEIAMIFQDSLSALNPVYTVGNKMVELIRRHTSITKKEAKARVLELLTAVGITDPEKAYILPAKLLALTVYKLLKNGGQEAKKITKSYTPVFNKESYIQYVKNTIE